MLHIPLAFNDGRPVPRTTLKSYDALFRRQGAVSHHPGIGAWIGSSKQLELERDDHVTIQVRVSRVHNFLLLLLPKMREDFRQEVVLAEIFHLRSPDPMMQPLAHVEVDISLNCQCPNRVRKLLQLLSALAGGATEYADAGALHVYAAVDERLGQSVRHKLALIGESPMSWVESAVFYPNREQAKP